MIACNVLEDRQDSDRVLAGQAGGRGPDRLLGTTRATSSSVSRDGKQFAGSR